MNAETKIYLFIGPASSGKTRLAKEILKHYPGKHIDISGRSKHTFEDPFLFRLATPETEILFIDDLTDFKKSINTFITSRM